MTYVWDFNFLFLYRKVLFGGVVVTLGLTFISIAIGTFLGLVFAYLSTSDNKFVRNFSKSYVSSFRAIPVLILLIWMYYFFPLMFGINISAFATAIIVFSLSLSAFVAEVTRSAFEAISVNQIDAARMIGLTNFQITVRIIFPQAVRHMIPNLTNEYITLFKFSGIASIITVNDLLHISSEIISVTYRPLEVYTTIAIIYTMLVFIFTYISREIEYRMLMKIAGSKDNLKKIKWWNS